MPPAFGEINDLETGRGKVGLQLRVIRLFETPEYRNKNEVFSYDCVLHDKTGTRIHATIGKTLIPKFKPILCEGKVYAFMNYVVAENSSRYKTTTSNYKLLIFNQTRICEVTDDNFPAHIYNFKSFEEITNLKNTHEGHMFDVIGAIGSCYKPETREAKGTSTKLVDIVLEDEQRRTLACTLWEEYANQLLEYLKKEPKEPVAIIIQFCRPTNYKGELKVTNAYCATKIISDENETEIQEFIEKYARNAKPKSTMAATDTTARIRFLDKETDFDIPLKTISELQCDKKAGQYWVYATIFELETIGAWAYMACNRCYTKMSPSDAKFYCTKCATDDIGGKYRYNLTLRVIDDKGTAAFHLWDRECLSLIGKPASELNIKAGDLDCLPVELEALNGKEALFKVLVKEGQTYKNFQGAYDIKKVISEPQEIQKYCDHTRAEKVDGAALEKRKDIEGATIVSNIGPSSKRIMMTPNTEDNTCEFVEGSEEGIDNDKPIDEVATSVYKKKCRKIVKKEKN